MDKFSILCLDDEKIVLSVLKRELELNPAYRVFTAESARDALRLVQERTFDAYLVDQYMPHMDGTTFVRKLKEMDPEAVVFYLTGQDFDGKAYKASLPDGKNGGAYYFTKPWNESLYVGLAQALKAQKEKKRLDRENKKLSLWVSKVLNETSLVQLLNEKPGLDKVMDHLFQSLQEQHCVEDVDIYLLSGKRLELMRSTRVSNRLTKDNKDLAFKSLSDGPLLHKTARGWIYYHPIGVKEQKIGLTCLRLQKMDDDNLQFIDYMIFQGGIMLEQMLVQIQLTNALSELKETQKKLIEAEKSNLISGLARWLMHNINNIICGLKGDTDLMKMSLHNFSADPQNLESLTAQLADSLPSMENGIQRLIHLIDSFRFMANINKSSIRRNEFNRLIEIGVQNFIGLKKVNPKRVKIIEKYAPLLEFVKVNRELIVRMIEELLIKAYDALQGKPGTIEIKTRKHKNWAEISITNSGDNLNINNNKWLDEPLFSTNIPLELGGMGLVLIKESVNFHQGEITFTSKAGKGSTILVRLPLLDSKLSRKRDD